MERSEPREEELNNAKAETVVRLRAAGITDLDERQPVELLATVLDAVEVFEKVVRDKGGDLMVDEPPRGREPQPDDPRFVVPRRNEDESLTHYANRIRSAARELRSS